MPHIFLYHLYNLFVMRGLVKSLVLLFVALAMFSCTEVKNDYTPYISFSAFLHNPVIVNDSIVGCKDSLAAAYDASLNSYVLDTLPLNDTVLFMVGFGSRGNDLTAAIISADTFSLKMHYSVVGDIKAALASKSKPENGELYFVSGYNFVLFPVTYVARKAGVHKMTFTVRSDSKFSPVSYTFLQPVAAAE